ncbi:hypothetical protein BHE74_00019832, partial [Ensete ventricosum]
FSRQCCKSDDEERHGLGEQVDVEEVVAEHDVVDGAIQEEESHEDLRQVDSDATEVCVGLPFHDAASRSPVRPGAVLVPGSVPQLGGDDPLVDAVRLQKPYYGRLGSVHRHDVLEQDPEDDQVEGPAP